MNNDNLNAFGIWLEINGRSPFTVSGYIHDLKLFSSWNERVNGIPLSPYSLSVRDVLAYRTYLLMDQRASVRTYNRRLAALRAYVKWAREGGSIEWDPLENLRMLREHRPGSAFLGGKELSAVKRAAKRMVKRAKKPREKALALRDYAILSTLFSTGLRIHELCELDMTDIELSRRSGWLCVSKGSDIRRRKLRLRALIRLALEEWLEVRPWTKSSALFISLRSRRRVTRRAMQTCITRIGKSAGVKVTAQTLRHTFAKSLIEAGVSIDKVTRMLGLSDRYYTARIYGDSNDETSNNASE